MTKISVRTAEWTNGLGIRITGAWQFDEKTQQGVFRVSNGLKIPALQIIGLESFRWNEPVIIDRS